MRPGDQDEQRAPIVSYMATPHEVLVEWKNGVQAPRERSFEQKKTGGPCGPPAFKH